MHASRITGLLVWHVAHVRILVPGHGDSGRQKQIVVPRFLLWTSAPDSGRTLIRRVATSIALEDKEPRQNKASKSGIVMIPRMQDVPYLRETSDLLCGMCVRPCRADGH